ncbi:MAG: DUF4173 domain-containing protein [Gammaproteobacteria bacterium]|nr:DUF4173 domain-containing protein [Gammaproteobacteria bacterium]
MDSTMETVRQRGDQKLTTIILLLGVNLGFLADQLIGTAGPVGLGFFVWSSLFALAFGWLTFRVHSNELKSVLAWSAVALLATGLILLRTTPVLVVSLLLVMAVAMAMIILQLGGLSLLNSTLADHLRAMSILAWRGGFGALPVVSNTDFSAGLKHPQLWAALRGTMLALPLIVIFVILFSSADAGFDRLASNLFDHFSADLLRHLSLTALFTWISIGLLACVLGNGMLKNRKPFRPFKLATIDTAILMSALAVLFLVFVFLQLGYLFGGRETIEATSGLTLAQYARRGFFELLTVAGLTLSLLITVAGSGCNQRVFRPLATVLVGCVLITQASALQRLLLYVDEFGLTIDRLAALAVMTWLAGGILLFSGTLMRGQARLFAAGMTSSGIAIIFLLAIVNPGALVAEVNIERASESNRTLDFQHLIDLGSDAVPVLIENLEKLPVAGRCQSVHFLFSNWYDSSAPARAETVDWRGWTYSESRAARLIEKFEEQYKDLAAGCLASGQTVDFFGRLQYQLLVNGELYNADPLTLWINSTN